MSEPLLARPIAAIATAPGRGAVALLRLSGAGALDVFRSVAPSISATPEPRMQRLVALRHPESGDLLDRGLATWFPAPGSYTGEDTVEIATHGGPLTPHLVLDALLAAGARPAEPGEFTRRAYLNGRLDLLQAEAVLDLIDGGSRALHRAAVHQMEGGLSRRVEALRSAIVGVEALIAYSIDFPEEDEPPVPPARIIAAAEDVAAQISELVATAPEGEMLREGALTVLAGRPNSGKSSLFNALVGSERAIVTDVPGTTRDAVEAVVSIEGFPFRLVDTAGLRETEDRVEGIGIEVARRYLAAAELILFCVDADREMDGEEEAFLAGLDRARVILVRTKADQDHAGLPDEAAHPLSAHTGAGLAGLREALLAAAFGGIRGDSGEVPLVTRARHARALRAANEEIATFLDAMRSDVPMEFAATHLHAAVDALEALIGTVSIDDLLDRVFGDFCVGK